MNLLKEAVLGVVKEMKDQQGDEFYDFDDQVAAIGKWVGLLELACKMTPDEVPHASRPSGPFVTHGDVYAAAMKEAEENARVKRKETKRDEREVSMAQMIGGDNDGIFAPIPPEAPIGGKTLMGDQVYILSQERNLVYSETETKKHQNLSKPVEEKKVILTS